MCLLSPNQFAYLWSAFLFVGLSQEVIEIGIGPARKDEIPKIKTTVLKDECDKVEMIRNRHRPDFFLILTKCSHALGTGKGSLYTYDPDKSDFRLVELKTSAGITKLDEVIPTGDMMLCISKSKNVTFLIDETLQIKNLQPLVPNYKYYPHPDHPNIIMRYPIESKNDLRDSDFTIDHGNNWYPRYRTFRKFDWIPNSTKYVFIDYYERINVLNVMTDDLDVKYELVSDYKIYEDHILVMQPIGGVTYNLYIIDVGRKIHSPAFFPALLRIRDVKFFEYAFGNYYIALVHKDLITCLWITTATPFHFVRKACYSAPTNASIESNIHIDKRVEGQIYFNLPSNANSLKTHISTDDGRYWDLVKLETKPYKISKPTQFNFTLYDPRSVPEHFGFMDFQYEKLKDGLQPFMTINGGHTWNPTPKSISRVLMLNYETAILSISRDLSAINYSLDKGATWLSHKLFPENSAFHHLERLFDTNLNVLIVTGTPQDHLLRFDIVDFSNFFKFECKKHHFRQIPLLRSRELCFRGTKMDIITRDPEIRCLNKLHELTKVEYFCPCSSEDFGCSFNFHPKDDDCVLDPLSKIAEEPFKCEKGTHVDITQLGYIKLATDTCDPHEFHLYYNVSTNSSCIQNELTNFLILRSSTNIYVSQLTVDGGHYTKQQTFDVVLNNKVNLNKPLAFDHTRQHLYNNMDRYITRFQMHGQNIHVVYFQNDSIKDMVYDPISRVLIYMNDRQELKILSLESNYEYVASNNVTWFTYSPHQRLLSTVMSKNYLCYFDLLGSPTCIKSSFELLKSFFDRQNSRIFLLTTAYVLIIQQFVKDPSNLQPLAEISGVSYFVVYDDHLYFLKNNQLLYRSLNKTNMEVRLIKNATFISLTLHRELFKDYKYTCESLKCQFFCHSAVTDELTCECPSPMIRVDKNCICPKDDLHCRMPQCAGFLCNNSKCLINNVRCNGVDDCGDKSDEMDCKKKCPSEAHLCQNKCFIKDAACGPVAITVIDPEFKTTKMKRRIYPYLIALACLAVLVYPAYRATKWIYHIYRVRRMNLNLHSQALEPFEYSELLEVENQGTDIMPM